ncbi:MAG TPA: ABC transporter ATP-binding protein [Candidatus Dormibacteraeota bacterium]|jgi:branched-chain amino acid transport system permease protein
MNALQALEALLHGPFGDFPVGGLNFGAVLVLAWQIVVFGGLALGIRTLVRRRIRISIPHAQAVGRAVRRPLGDVRVLLAVAVVLPLAEMLTGGYYLTVTYNVELYVLLAIGLNIVVGYTGLLDLGYVAFFAVGAYVYGIFASPQLGQTAHATFHFLVPASQGPGVHISMLVMLPVAGFAAALFGVLIGIPTLRLRGDYLAIVTLGFGEITRIFAQNLDSPVNITNGPNGVTRIDDMFIGGYSFGDITNHIGPVSIPPFLNYYYLVLLLIVVTVFVVARLATSRVGRAWTAIREDEVAAEVAGIHTRNLKLLAYASGGFFGGMAGAVFAAGSHVIAPESFQLFLSILVLCMVVVGGMGSIEGAALGAVAIGLPYFLSSQLQSLRVLIFGVILVLMIALRPQGLLPSRQRQRELSETVDDGTGAPHVEAVADLQQV